MGTYPADELLKQWKLETLSQEQAIGHLLQHLVKLSESVESLTYQQPVMQQKITAQSVNWANLKDEVDQLRAQVVLLQTEVQRLLKQADLPSPTKRRRPG